MQSRVHVKRGKHARESGAVATCKLSLNTKEATATRNEAFKSPLDLSRTSTSTFDNKALATTSPKSHGGEAQEDAVYPAGEAPEDP
jgi:hypothetical protein